MPALEMNQTNSVLPAEQGHGVSHSPWGYHATTVGGKRKNKTKQKRGGKSCKNKRRSKYTRQKQNRRTRKQRK